MLDTHDKTEPVPFEAKVVEPARFDQNDGMFASFETGMAFINTTGMTVSVVTRNGALFVIPSAHRVRTTESLTIRMTYNLSQHVSSNLHGASRGIMPSDSKSLQILRELMTHKRQLYYPRDSFSIDYHIDLFDIESRGGVIYLTDLDIVVALGECNPIHPYSDAATRRRMIGQTDGLPQVDAFGYTIRIVDKTGQFGPRYVNINGAVYKVAVSRDWADRDGVYLISSGAITSDFDNPPPQVRRYEFTEAEEALGLYRTYDDAKNFGDAMAARKRELEKELLAIKEREQAHKNERIRLEAELEKQRQEYEKEKLEFERRQREEEARLKAMREEIEHEKKLQELRRKEYYESLSYQRKDMSETIKFIPVVVTGAAAIGYAILKAMNQKS